MNTGAGGPVHLQSEDGHLSLLLHILAGIPSPEQRAGWVRLYMPLTYGLMDLPGGSWEPPEEPRLRRPVVALPAPVVAEPSRRRNYGPQICKRCTQPFAPTTGRQWYCPVCQRIRRPVPLTEQPCQVCGLWFQQKLRRQRTCGAKACRQAIHNAAEQRHWVRRGAERQSRWYWERGGKEAKRSAHAAKRVDAEVVA